MFFMPLLPAPCVHPQLSILLLTSCTCSLLRGLFFGYWSRAGSIWSLQILLPTRFAQQVSQGLTAVASRQNSSPFEARRGNIWGVVSSYPQDEAQAGTSPEIIALVGFSPHMSCFSCALSNFPSIKHFHLNPLTSESVLWKPHPGHQINPMPESPWAWESKTFLQPSVQGHTLLLTPYWRSFQNVWQWSLWFFSGEKKVDSLRAWPCPKAPTR